MADRLSIAIRTEAAIGAMEEAAEKLAAAFDVDVPDFPRNDKDPSVLRARQLESIAVFLTALASSVEQAFADTGADDEPEDDLDDEPDVNED